MSKTGKTSEENTVVKPTPYWALDERADEYGAVTCKVCKKVQADSFDACIACCTHDILNFSEEWDHGWRISMECTICGKNFGFSNKVLIQDFKAIRVQVSD